MESIYNMAKLYYPVQWDKARIDALYAAGKLSDEEYVGIIGEGETEGSGIPSDD